MAIYDEKQIKTVVRQILKEMSISTPGTGRGKKIIIIGAVAAGMSAATKITRLDKSADVVVYEAGEHVSYGACGLPYYISGDNDDIGKLFAKPLEYFSKAGINIHTNHAVTKVSPADKTITVRDLKNDNFITDHYDKLLIATGARAVTPDVEGANKQGVYTIKTVPDAEKLREEASRHDINNAVIVGGGYIGIEACEAMLKRGIKVTLVEAADRILGAFEPEMSEIARGELEKHGVSIKTGEHLVKIEGTARVEKVVTDKTSYKADLVIIALGVKPNTEFLQDSGVSLAENGAVITDREMRTNIGDIYAAGDCALVYSHIAAENVYLPLGGPANKCGRVAAANMLGGRDKFIGVLGSAAIKVMGIEIAQTGLTAAQAAGLKIDFAETIVTAADHPAYYPGQTPLTIKLISEKKSGKLLGASACGEKGAVLRIDALAVAVYAGLSVETLAMMDFCYAPPFATVWDAMNVAGNRAAREP